MGVFARGLEVMAIFKEGQIKKIEGHASRSQQHKKRQIIIDLPL